MTPVQTDPPTLPVKLWYPDGHFPKGQVIERTRFPEGQESQTFLQREQSSPDQQERYEDLRQAAEVHRQVPMANMFLLTEMQSLCVFIFLAARCDSMPYRESNLG